MIRKMLIWVIFLIGILAFYLYVPVVNQSVNLAVTWISERFANRRQDVPADRSTTTASTTVVNNVVTTSGTDSPPIGVGESVKPTKASYTIRDFGYTYDDRRVSPFATSRLATGGKDDKERKTWFDLTAIVYNTTSPSNSSAILRVTTMTSDSRPEERQVSYVTVRVGQLIEGYEVMSIKPDRVVLREVATKKEIEVMIN